MATFTWHEVTVSVGEMSRAQALDCARQFDLLARVYSTYDDLMAETDVLGVLNAPAAIKIGGEVFTGGERTIVLSGGETIRLVLPLTRECFNALPMSLTLTWVDAMLRSNGWLIESIKKALSLTTEKKPEPQSGSEPSSEPIQASVTIPTTG